jgi:hypothetical protein
VNSREDTGRWADPVLRWETAEECKAVVLRFMALFDAREWVAMESCVAPDIEWQRPDVTISGLSHMRQVLAGTPADVRVRHTISNQRVAFEPDGAVIVESYFTVYRHVGALPQADAAAPLQGPASVGRYCDELRQVLGAWCIARKRTWVDFRRV